jgi:hypothetical protein
MGQVSNAKADLSDVVKQAADMIFGVMYKAAHSPKARRKATSAYKEEGKP